MRTLTLSVICIAIAITSVAQTKYGIKIYQNTDLFETRSHESQTNTTTEINNVNFTRISLAFDIQTSNKYVHEIEFLIPEFSKTISDLQLPLSYEYRKGSSFDGHGRTFSLRYELSKTLTKESSRLAFNLGAGINPYYMRLDYTPNIEMAYHVQNQLYGFALNVTPRLKYKLSDRFGVEVNIPINVYDLRRNWLRIDNPAIPIRQQTSSRYDNILFERAYTVRVGVAYSLN